MRYRKVMNIKITPKVKNFFLGTGDHIVEIIEAAMTMSKELKTPLGETPKWNDRTPQLQILVRNPKGMITSWLNLKAFKNVKDFTDGVAPAGHEFRSFDESSEKFLVNLATNTRVESIERTAVLHEQVANFAACAGFTDEDGEMDLDEIMAGAIGQTTAVRVRENTRCQLEVSNFMLPERVKVIA